MKKPVTINILPHSTLCPNGANIEAQSGDNLCKLLIKNNIKIEHACEMSCACTTCHVVIKSGMSSLPNTTDNEDDLLDMAWGVSANSRLSCQVIVGEQDLVIEIPKYTINHAREEH